MARTGYNPCMDDDSKKGLDDAGSDSSAGSDSLDEHVNSDSETSADSHFVRSGEEPSIDAEEMASTSTPFQAAAKKVRSFPQSPGVYLMKDAAGVVIYVGKATNLRSRAGSYFLKAAAMEPRTSDWIGEIADVDFIDSESEVDALLVESRLIKDIQPQHNKIQKDDKSFPYLQITT